MRMRCNIEFIIIISIRYFFSPIYGEKICGKFSAAECLIFLNYTYYCLATAGMFGRAPEFNGRILGHMFIYLRNPFTPRRRPRSNLNKKNSNSRISFTI